MGPQVLSRSAPSNAPKAPPNVGNMTGVELAWPLQISKPYLATCTEEPLPGALFSP